MDIGQYQTLKIHRRTDHGFYLINESEEEVLLPNKYIEDDMELEDEIEVFIYIDSSDLPVATTEIPFLVVGEFAYLKVSDVTNFGAFMDWGLIKDLLVPLRNQAEKMQKDNSYVIYLYLDEKSERLVGTNKVENHLIKVLEDDLVQGDAVDVLVYERTDLGFKVIVENKYAGLIYHNEVYQNLDIGDRITGFVKPIREDRKLDISTNPIGHHSIEPNASKILYSLTDQGGFLKLHDKSSPEDIKDQLQMSKKQFKKAIGSLYKDKMITIESDGIRLVKNTLSD